MALAPGSHVGPYELTSALGAGGMGEVWRARDKKLNRDVALKVLPDSFANDASRLARLTHEAQTLAALNHPNIAAIYGLEDSAGVRALVMELVEGDDLSRRIAGGAIPLDEATQIAAQIAAALAAAHEQGIIHRDLKPANIKLRTDGTVKVLDFGLAKAMAPAGSALLVAAEAETMSRPTPTLEGVIVGTAAYMSPEQARGKPVDKRTDIWAFGVVLFEMLAGRRPFPGGDFSEVLGGVVLLEPNWAALPPGLPPGVTTLLHGCLVKHPGKRIADISTALFVLERLGPLDGSDTRLDGPGGPARPEPRRWRHLAVAGWALAALALTLALTLGRFGPQDAPPLIRFAVEASTHVVFGEFTAEPYPAVSPDGSAIAFVANTASAKNQLFVRPVEAAEPVAIDRAVNVQWPFWSADGRHIAYFTDGRIRRVPAAGGAQSDVAPAVAFGGTWNASDDILFGTDEGVMRVAAGGGTPRPVTTVDSAQGDRSHRYPAFLPDGRRFVFCALGTTSERAGVFIGSLDGGEPRRLLSDVANAVPAGESVLLFVRDGSLLAQRFDPEWERPVGEPVRVASGMPTGTGTLRYAPVSAVAGTLAYRAESRPVTQLAVVDRGGRPLSTLGPPGFYLNPAWSPDGRWVVASRSDPNSGGMNLWKIDVARGDLLPLSSGPFFESHPVWSADSQRLVFASTRGGQFAIYESLLSTGGQRLVLGIPGSRVVPHGWSGDQSLLYYTVEGGSGPEGDVWEHTFDTSSARPIAQTEADESQARVSPDGRTIAYASDASGRWEVYLRPLDPARMTVKLSTNGGTNPVWRADGSEVYYLEVEEETRSAVAVNGWLMAVATAPGASPTVGEPRRLFRARWPAYAMNELWTYWVDAGGDRFVINAVVSEAKSPLAVTLGWRRLLSP